MFTGPLGTVWYTMLVIPRSFPHHSKMDGVQRADLIGFLYSSVRLFPNTKIAQDAQDFMTTNVFKAETGQEAFAYVVDMYNATMTHSKQRPRTAVEVDRIMNARVNLELKTIQQTEKKHTQNVSDILELQKERNRLLAVPHAVTNSTLQTLVIVAIVIAALALFFVIVFSLIILNRMRASVAYDMRTTSS